MDKRNLDMPAKTFLVAQLGHLYYEKSYATMTVPSLSSQICNPAEGVRKMGKGGKAPPDSSIRFMRMLVITLEHDSLSRSL